MMKKIIAGCLFLSLAACSPKPAEMAITLQKGQDCEVSNGMFSISQRGSSSIDAIYPEVKNLPADWSDIQIYYMTADFPQAVFQGYHAGVIDHSLYESYFDACGLDTAQYSLTSQQLFVPMAFGVNAAKDTCYLFDANGNYDFSDDKPLLYKEKQPVAVTLDRKADNGAIWKDTLWLEPSFMKGRMFLSHKESATATFSVGGEEYTCKVIPSVLRYGTDASIQISDKDTTVWYAVGQYARLGQSYYLIDSLSPMGTYMHLTEDKEALSKPTLQVGFRPYPFEAVTTAGDTLRFPEDFKGKQVMLNFWSTGCGACRVEMQQDYPELYKRYKDAGFEILSIADNSAQEIEVFRESCPMDWLTVADRDHNRELQQLYQVSYFPTLYLINGEGLITADDKSLRGSALEATLHRLFPEVPIFTSYNPDEFEQLLDSNPDMQLVDVRTEPEYAAGAIRNALLIDVKKDDFAQQVDAKLDKSRPVAVYCRGGVRSRKAAWILIDKGFTVYNLDKGYTSWEKAKK